VRWVSSFASALAAISCEKVPLLAPSGSTITLSTATSALGFNGTADVSAQVLEAPGPAPQRHAHHLFDQSRHVDPAEVQTDVNGRARPDSLPARHPASPRYGELRRRHCPCGERRENRVGSAAVSAVVASANPSIVSSRGGNSTISAKVTDAGGNALAGIPVTFTTDAGR
jgi:hypothetical protein